MNTLIRKANLPDADGFYAELLGAHEGLSVEESNALNARLVLILANHIGDGHVLREALRLGIESGGKSEQVAFQQKDAEAPVDLA
jgi:hypothetical protein